MKKRRAGQAVKSGEGEKEDEKKKTEGSLEEEEGKIEKSEQVNLRTLNVWVDCVCVYVRGRQRE